MKLKKGQIKVIIKKKNIQMVDSKNSEMLKNS